MPDRAPVLVHGATGYTGRLVCSALKARAIPFAIGGRDAAKLDALSASLGGVESCAIDITSAESIRKALEGRRLVSACAGPFVLVGEAVLAACARMGVNYIDTTGEQRFVADAISRYRATAEASGACVVPAMAYEIAFADWAASAIARTRSAEGGGFDEITVLYVTRFEKKGSVTSRGTRASALGMLTDPSPKQYVEGALVTEALGEVVRAFELRSGRSVTGVSFPSPEAIVFPSHTRARTVRTFMSVSRRTAAWLHRARDVAPSLARLAKPFVSRWNAKSNEGPGKNERAATRFEIIVEGARGTLRSRCIVTGADPYGLTAEIQAYAASCVLAGYVLPRGVVAPSVAFPYRNAFDALKACGVETSESTDSFR